MISIFGENLGYYFDQLTIIPQNVIKFWPPVIHYEANLQKSRCVLSLFKRIRRWQLIVSSRLVVCNCVLLALTENGGVLFNMNVVKVRKCF